MNRIRWSFKSIATKVLAINLFLVVIILVVFLFLSIYYNNKIQKELSQSSIKSLGLLSNTVEKEMKRLRNLMLLCKDEPVFVLSLSNRDQSIFLDNALQASKQLSAIKYALPYAQNVFAYSEINSKFIIANKSIQSKDTFIKYFNRMMDKEESVPDFSSLKDGFHVYSKFILYVMNVQSYGPIIVQIDTAEFKQFINMKNTLLNYSFVVLNHSNQLFIQNMELSQDDLATIIMMSLDGETNYPYQNKKYSVVQKKEPLSGYTYVLFQNADFAGTEYFFKNIIFIASGLFLMLICSAMIILNAVAYRPLKAIARKFATTGKVNEIEVIGQKLNELADENMEMSQKLTIFRTIQHDIALNHLLASTEGIDDTMLETMKQKYVQYVVIAIAMQNSNGDMDRTLAKKADDYFAHTFDGHAINLDPVLKAYILPAGLQRDEIAASVKECFNTSMEDTRVFVGYSDSYNDVLKMRLALEQARERLLETTASVEGDPPLSIYEDENNSGRGSYTINLDSQNMLATVVLNSSPDKIREVLYQLLFSHKPITLRGQMAAYDILASLLRTIISTANIDAEDLSLKLDHERVDYHPEFMYRCLVEDYIQVNHVYKQGSGNLKHQIIKYIHDNYDQNLSLDLLADKFNFSPAYLSTWFKKNVGMNMMEFISKVRIKAAIDILTTDKKLKISEVAFQVGFINVMTFIRQFKQIVGTTPEQYRKNLNQPNKTE